MAWQEITDEELETGEPVSTETAQKIKNNLALLQQRMVEMEGGSSTVYPPIVLGVIGTYGEPGDLAVPAEGILKVPTNFNFLITGVRILIDKSGISGLTEIDLSVRRAAGGAYASLLTTRPSVDYSEGNDAYSDNGVINPAEAQIQAGDIIRLDITQAQRRGETFYVRIDYVKV